MFSNNLDTIFGGNEDREASTSIHLSMMGQKVKIFDMFSGYKELLSLVWSVPKSLTSFFDINFLTNDQNEYVLLQNGMMVRVESLGGLSFDLSGSGDISVWSQYAKTRLKLRLDKSFQRIEIIINYWRNHLSKPCYCHSAKSNTN